MLPEKIRALAVSIGDADSAGQLLKTSTYEFRYLDPDPEQPPVALLMPPKERLTWQDGDLFPPMDQNLPEGDLFMKIRELFPKQPMTPMHLLALIGRNGIGRLGYSLPEHPLAAAPPPLSKDELLKTRYTPEVFNELVAAYLSTGAGIAGMQPKIMVPDRPTIPIPSLIVKAASAAYPSLAANEYLCLSAARSAGIEVPSFALSDDGQMLILDRFDLVQREDGRIERLGFEDVAALAGLRVREILSDRKYQGSYQRIAELLRQLRLHSDNLHRFFQQVAFSVMVRNGDAHLKNFGVLYRSSADVWLAPMFDVVTTSVYRYAQYPGGPELEDRTLALKLFAGRHRTKTYPTTEELHDFGRRICGVSQPARVLEAIAEAMHRTLEDAKGDARVPAGFLAKIREAWAEGMLHARRAPAAP
ncbi:type II toxin-antitoxin system HipA family toxin [Variovorax sp. WS11]|uniref:type II toxin-antitoxin system HipA family toxin n=1 Tax=Variovorax sp. WS11 TaxID=1105204 RepID=UPI000D0D016F|nr:type II toxin-antitoxin system HipA family toxin [Variovorax sp. WS11]NDZ13808.1 type II toxin-antitoxin system HipA family toxin [Variovorax sp. WS11]PSL79129.1 type II toxin-antitoxin system HipA family toxin [Variovorax sp. WS11]